MPSFQKGAVLYRKLRHRKGHGVHSPFVYNLITKVIEEKTPYYAFDKIKNVTQESNERKSANNRFFAKKNREHRYGTLLFRLINFFKCNVVLEIGSPEEAIGLYMASANSECKCIVLDEDKYLCSRIKELADKADLKNLQTKCGSYSEKIHEVFEEEEKIDLIFINIPEHDNCPDILSKSISNAGENCIFVLNGIRKNQRMKKLWDNVTQNSQITISIDLYTSGIFFLRKNIYKQHYKTYFNHGKEQNIHKNRRQGFDFFSWGKKNF